MESVQASGSSRSHLLSHSPTDGSVSQGRLLIGVDVGGTKIELVALDRTTGEERYRQRVASPQQSYDSTLACIHDVIVACECALGEVGSVGIGMPGSLVASPNMGEPEFVKNSNSVWLNGRPMLTDLTRLLNRDIRIANDANCFAVSEAVDGAAAGKHCVFGVIIGTGCGGGLVVDGKALTGINNLAGEWGHNPLPFPLVYQEACEGALSESFDPQEESVTSQVKPHDIYHHKSSISYTTHSSVESEYPGPACYCGRRGCVETWVSGTGFQWDYQRVSGQSLLAPEIMGEVHSGNEVAKAVFDRYCERLAKSLAQVINTVDPDVIVLGGGMSNVHELYAELPQRWQKYVFSDHCVTPVLPAKHGDSSGVRGAAWLGL